MTLQELLTQIKAEPPGRENGDRYQREFGELVGRFQPKVIIETGVHRGVSTAYILEALQPDAVLHSCDPDPINVIEHPQWRFYRQKSVDALPKIYLETGPWDIFLHDSDHGSENQTFEYELAWHLVRDGGIIATDDPVWGNHGAWSTFCARHNATTQKCGSAEYIVKAGAAITPEQLHDVVEQAAELGRSVAGIY
jgi:predicted O-methyltransferase YrrM